jgi:nucleoside-diphosphate-sugar epimerase
VAILGATSHIAKGLIAAWLNDPRRILHLYARSPELAGAFVAGLGGGQVELFPVEAFGAEPFDVVVNCIGIGDPGKLRDQAATIFALTETWDNRVIKSLERWPEALYLNFSSGAAYGTDFSKAVDASTPACFRLNCLASSEFYGIAKLHAEAKHRALQSLNIVDLRVFSYFSRFIDLSTRFLLSDIIVAIQSGTELVTTPSNIVRDYVHPDDLAALVDCCIKARRLNEVYDVYSAKPAAKFEILEAFAARFGLQYRVTDDAVTVDATGSKDHYYSRNHRAETLGYTPCQTSLDALMGEAGAILVKQGQQFT